MTTPARWPYPLAPQPLPANPPKTSPPTANRLGTRAGRRAPREFTAPSGLGFRAFCFKKIIQCCPNKTTR